MSVNVFLRILAVPAWLALTACASGPSVLSAQTGHEVAPHQRGVIHEASIAFANNGGIRNWRSLDDSTLFIEDQFGNVYLARLTAPSSALAFSEAIAFITSPGGTFDRFSSVSIRGVRYGLSSFERTEAPAKRKASSGTPGRDESTSPQP